MCQGSRSCQAQMEPIDPGHYRVCLDPTCGWSLQKFSVLSETLGAKVSGIRLCWRHSSALPVHDHCPCDLLPVPACPAVPSCYEACLKQGRNCTCAHCNSHSGLPLKHQTHGLRNNTEVATSFFLRQSTQPKLALNLYASAYSSCWDCFTF